MIQSVSINYPLTFREAMINQAGNAESCNCSIKTFGVNFYFFQINFFPCFQAVISLSNFQCLNM
jgi:hypothetical protein